MLKENSALISWARGEDAATPPPISSAAARALQSVLADAPGANAASVEALCASTIPQPASEDWVPLDSVPHVFVCRVSGRVHACSLAMPSLDVDCAWGGDGAWRCGTTGTIPGEPVHHGASMRCSRAVEGSDGWHCPISHCMSDVLYDSLETAPHHSVDRAHTLVRPQSFSSIGRGRAPLSRTTTAPAGAPSAPPEPRFDDVVWVTVPEAASEAARGALARVRDISPLSFSSPSPSPSPSQSPPLSSASLSSLPQLQAQTRRRRRKRHDDDTHDYATAMSIVRRMLDADPTRAINAATADGAIAAAQKAEIKYMRQCAARGVLPRWTDIVRAKLGAINGGSRRRTPRIITGHVPEERFPHYARRCIAIWQHISSSRYAAEGANRFKFTDHVVACLYVMEKGIRRNGDETSEYIIAPDPALSLPPINALSKYNIESSMSFMAGRNNITLALQSLYQSGARALFEGSPDLRFAQAIGLREAQPGGTH